MKAFDVNVGVSPGLLSQGIPRLDSLNIPFAHLFAYKALFVLVSHVLEEFVRREERLVAKLKRP